MGRTSRSRPGCDVLSTCDMLSFVNAPFHMRRCSRSAVVYWHPSSRCLWNSAQYRLRSDKGKLHGALASQHPSGWGNWKVARVSTAYQRLQDNSRLPCFVRVTTSACDSLLSAV
ncbi:hypothetical protein BCV70DRAFT_108594 [Testicularia cyperi]|uniref:Uncharacterized protein n=1 Tax=Testicularia cyperi TaxID=1882483 RepID=A0A317XR97_9BASI|nr:hypothetical protein BCV70DRAFT_108594 [Testicularia cyperi]